MLRRWLIFVGGTFVVFALLATAFSLLALGAQHTYTVRSEYTGIRSIVIDGGSGDVHLTGAPAGSPLVVREHVTRSFGTPDRRALRTSRDALRLSYHCPGIPECGVEYGVTVPANVSVTARTGNGSIDANGLTSSQIDLESGTGDIIADLLRPATRLRVVAGIGDINLTVPDVSYAFSADSGLGDVRAGSLRIDPNSPRRIEAHSDTGDVAITARRP